MLQQKRHRTSSEKMIILGMTVNESEGESRGNYLLSGKTDNASRALLRRMSALEGDVGLEIVPRHFELRKCRKAQMLEQRGRLQVGQGREKGEEQR